jgi:hypothetical protein
VIDWRDQLILIQNGLIYVGVVLVVDMAGCRLARKGHHGRTHGQRRDVQIHASAVPAAMCSPAAAARTTANRLAAAVDGAADRRPASRAATHPAGPRAGGSGRSPSRSRASPGCARCNVRPAGGVTRHRMCHSVTALTRCPLFASAAISARPVRQVVGVLQEPVIRCGRRRWGRPADAAPVIAHRRGLRIDRLMGEGIVLARREDMVAVV